MCLPLCFLLGHLAKHLPLVPCAPALLCMDCILYVDFTLKPAVLEKQVRKRTGSCFLFLLEIPALESTWQFIALFYQLFCFVSYRWLILSRQALTHHAHGKGWWLLRVCAGTSSSWRRSSISGASSAHLLVEAMWGRGRASSVLGQAVCHRPNRLHSGCRTHGSWQSHL